MQQTESTRKDQDARTRNSRAALVHRTGVGSARGDGPMGYGPRGPADESDPESHIFRGED
ncbi:MULTISPECIES: hypothetical protein [Streptomyces]|uniref:Uncharacterized protein n=1 Tax=Streptomyces cacaoi TaxID=1898 RepID=A0A4Y3R2W2_STRCI|nr:MULTISPECIES: hypothetical protein [Streptomyces]NNG86020.1 hypothetical protein [Streptomyces cacaoi]QHF94257.1 hypothetical protein DEH18_10830 [Streptomyces sp. NHF165]GEB51247.1 hypothetical protein SCA03_37980 [Streptomyces cacaoi]